MVLGFTLYTIVVGAQVNGGFNSSRSSFGAGKQSAFNQGRRNNFNDYRKKLNAEYVSKTREKWQNFYGKAPMVAPDNDVKPVTPIKMSDEDVPEDYYQYQPDEEDCQPVFYPIDHEVFPYADIMEEKVKN